MSISLTGSTIVQFLETSTTPASSYKNQGFNMHLFSSMICSDDSLWICVNNSDQSNLVWKNILYAS